MMKVKGIAAVALALVFMLAFSGCVNHVGPTATKTSTAAGAKFENIDFDTLDIDGDALVSHMNEKLKFDDKLYPMNTDIAEALFKVTGLLERLSVVGSTGSTAECIVFLKAANNGDAEAAAGKLRTYCADMSRVYSSYNVVESEKLSNAFIMKNGKYVIMCVSPDSKLSESVYKEYVLSVAK